MCDLRQGKNRVGKKKSGFKNAYPLLLSSFNLPKSHIAKGQTCAFFASKTVM